MTAIRSQGGGDSWLLWYSPIGPASMGPTLHLDHFDARGVRLGTPTLAAFAPHDLARHPDGRLTGWQNHCGAKQNAVCLATEGLDGRLREASWPAQRRTVTYHMLDWDGALVGTEARDVERRVMIRGVARADGLYALTNEGGYFVTALDDDLTPGADRPLFPPVAVKGVDPETPAEDLWRAAQLAQQRVTAPVAVSGGVVVAAAASRGTLAALNEQRGLDLPLPKDPACADILVVRVPREGFGLRYWVVPPRACARRRGDDSDARSARVGPTVGASEPHAVLIA